MNIRHPLSIAAVAAVLITALTMSVILAIQSADRTRTDLRAQLSELRETEQSLVSTVNQSLLKNILSTYEKELATPDSADELETTEFSALGSFTEETSSWSSDWSVTRAPQWGREWFKNLEKSISFEDVKGGELTWVHLVSDTGQVQFGLATLVQVRVGDQAKNKIIMAVTGPALLTALSDLSKGVASRAFVVDREGYTYSYPEPQYVGARIDSHPVVRGMLDNLLTANGVRESNVNNFTALDGSAAWGSYEFVPASNLAVVVTAPRPTVSQFVAQYFLHTILVTLGLAALTLLGFTFLTARGERERVLLRQNLEMANKKDEAVHTVGVGPKSTAPASTSLHSVTNLQVKEVVRGVADYLRTPLTALLGQLQIIEQNGGGANRLAPAIVEARRLRAFVENLSGEVELAAAKREVVDAVTVLNQVTANCRALLAKYDIGLEEGVFTEFSLRADFERVRSSLSTLLLFAIESLSTSPQIERKIKLRVEKLAGVGQIQIEAFGRIFDTESKKKIFMPFKTRLHQGALFGLDLVLAQARIEDMQGEVFVENIDTSGFRIVVRFATASTVSADQMMNTVESEEIYPPGPEIADPAAAPTLDPKEFMPMRFEIIDTAKVLAETRAPDSATDSASASASVSDSDSVSVSNAASEAAAAAKSFDVTEDFSIRKPKLRLEL